MQTYSKKQQKKRNNGTSTKIQFISVPVKFETVLKFKLILSSSEQFRKQFRNRVVAMARDRMGESQASEH